VNAALAVVVAYLIGSIPFAFLFARRKGHLDIRLVGSGNAGATNVFRVAGSRAGLLTVLVDIAKGAAVVLAARYLGASPGVCAWVGVAAVVGHIYPVWLGFRGGKGVATTCGAFGVLMPPAMLAAMLVFAAVVALSRTISLGSICAAACLGPMVYLMHAPAPVTRASFVAGLLVLVHHRSNLVGLIRLASRGGGRAEGHAISPGERR